MRNTVDIMSETKKKLSMKDNYIPQMSECEKIMYNLGIANTLNALDRVLTNIERDTAD